MAGKKYVFIIPGFKQKVTQKGYVEVRKVLKKEGFSPIPVVLSWRNKTVSENTELFLEKYKKTLKSKGVRSSQVYLLGFSFGAMVAFLAATKISVKGIILCSLSPYFSEDLPKKMSGKISVLQTKRFKDFTTLKHSTLAKQIKAKKIIMLYGTKESRPLIRRVTATFKKVPQLQKFLLSVRNTYHDIATKEYLYTLHTIAKEIL